MGMASPHPSQLWGTHLMKISPSFCPAAAQQCYHRCLSLQRPMGLQRAESSQYVRPPWCFCTSTSLRNWEFHLGKDAHKMVAQVQITLIFPCVQNAYQFCVVFLLHVMETHPASARKQQRKLQRQQTLTKSCPKASPHIHFPLHHLFCKCSKPN